MFKLLKVYIYMFNIILYFDSNLNNAEIFINDIKKMIIISLSDEENEVLFICYYHFLDIKFML